MPAMERCSIESPTETRPFAGHGRMDVFTLGNVTMGRGVFEPGWRWSTDVGPIAGTDTCMARHIGMCLSGSMVVTRSDDGSEMTISAGDLFVIEPGHDAWTVGDEPCVLLDTAVTQYAKPA
jgi:hypothetical protein